MAERKMTKSERDDLVRLVKQRERVAKTAAKQRSTAMLAEFEQKIAAVHDFNKDEVWKAAVEAAGEKGERTDSGSGGGAWHSRGISTETQLSLGKTWRE